MHISGLTARHFEWVPCEIISGNVPLRFLNMLMLCLSTILVPIGSAFPKCSMWGCTVPLHDSQLPVPSKILTELRKVSAAKFSTSHIAGQSARSWFSAKMSGASAETSWNFSQLLGPGSDDCNVECTSSFRPDKSTRKGPDVASTFPPPSDLLQWKLFLLWNSIELGSI